MDKLTTLEKYIFQIIEIKLFKQLLSESFLILLIAHAKIGNYFFPKNIGVSTTI